MLPRIRSLRMVVSAKALASFKCIKTQITMRVKVLFQKQGLSVWIAL